MSTPIKDQFAKDGYVVLRGLFSREYAIGLKAEAAKLLEKAAKNNSGVYLGMTKASPLFKAAAEYPELAAALKQIIGGHVVFLSDKIVYKDADTDYGSPWHQDYPYWKGSHKYSVWVALDDATPENGCLQVVPGSHLRGAVHHGGDASDGVGFDSRLKQNDIDRAEVVDLAASQGDAIIFHDLLFHSSYPNTSGKDRWALISTYKDGTQEDPAYEWAEAAFTVSG